MLVADGFEKYKDSLIRSIAIFSGDEQAAQDAVQYAFLKAVMNRELLEQMPELAMKAWLSAAARNAVVDSKRKQSRLVYSLDETLLSENPDQTDRLLIGVLLSKLPSRLQTIVCLRYYTRLSSTEIGRVMGIPAPTIRTMLRSALGLMRAMLKGDHENE